MCSCARPLSIYLSRMVTQATSTLKQFEASSQAEFFDSYAHPRCEGHVVRSDLCVPSFVLLADLHFAPVTEHIG